MMLVAVFALLLPGLLVSSLMRYPQRDPLGWLATLLCTASFWLAFLLWAAGLLCRRPSLTIGAFRLNPAVPTTVSS
jgi:hypothetical protein